MLNKMSNAEKNKIVRYNPLFNRNAGNTFTETQKDAIGRYIAAHSHISSISDRHIFVLPRANGTYARIFISGGMKRRESDQKMVLDLSNAFEISYIVGILTGQKLVKDQGVELRSGKNFPERALDICAYFNDNVEDVVFGKNKIHIADVRGVLYWQERYANYREFYPQDRPLY